MSKVKHVLAGFSANFDIEEITVFDVDDSVIFSGSYQSFKNISKEDNFLWREYHRILNSNCKKAIPFNHKKVFIFLLSEEENEKILSVIKTCDSLLPDESTSIVGFGENGDLTLFITKDNEYNLLTKAHNLVSISTKQNNVCVDDTGDIHVDDLYNELNRIYNYQDFSTF
jgi:hypothetical protein